MEGVTALYAHRAGLWGPARANSLPQSPSKRRPCKKRHIAILEARALRLSRRVLGHGVCLVEGCPCTIIFGLEALGFDSNGRPLRALCLRRPHMLCPPPPPSQLSEPANQSTHPTPTHCAHAACPKHDPRCADVHTFPPYALTPRWPLEWGVTGCTGGVQRGTGLEWTATDLQRSATRTEPSLTGRQQSTMGTGKQIPQNGAEGALVWVEGEMSIQTKKRVRTGQRSGSA